MGFFDRVRGSIREAGERLADLGREIASLPARAVEAIGGAVGDVVGRLRGGAEAESEAASIEAEAASIEAEASLIDAEYGALDLGTIQDELAALYDEIDDLIEELPDSVDWYAEDDLEPEDEIRGGSWTLDPDDVEDYIDEIGPVTGEFIGVIMPGPPPVYAAAYRPEPRTAQEIADDLPI